MERLGSKFGRGRGVATVDGQVACEALISFIIAPESALR
jgi:3-hydroxymyristoyl/3-hydroxydecanoyl-(acyl carrier protein) dehydratase